MKNIYQRQGIIDRVTLEADYIKVCTTDCIYHLPLTTEIINSGDGSSCTVFDLRKGFYFCNYFSNGQHVLVVKEKNAHFGVISGVYHAESKLVDDALLMKISNTKTKKLGAPLEDGSLVLAFCHMMTASLPPQATPYVLFVFRK